MSSKGFAVVLTARIDQYRQAMRDAAGATKQFSSEVEKKLEKTSEDFTRVGSKLTRNVTLPILALGGAAYKMSADFEMAFAQMVGLAGVAAEDVDGLRESVLALSGETAVAPQELADALYFAASAGLDTAAAMDAVTYAAEASAAGMGSAADIVGLVASAVASYGAENINAAEATDILTSTIRAGRADPAELAGTLGRILPIASSLGLTFDEVGGTVAYLSNVFGDTNRTVTAMSGFMVKLVSPTQQGRDALEDMGTSVEELHAAIRNDGLMGALDLLRTKGFAGNQQALRMLFDDIEGFQGALALLNDESGSLVGVLDEVKDSTGSLGTAFSAVADTDAFAAKQSWTEVKVAMIEAGDQLLPMVAQLAEIVGDLAQKFGELSPTQQAVVLGALAFAAAVGPLLTVMGNLIKVVLLVKGALVALGSAVIKHPVLAFATAIGLVIGAVVMFGDETDRTADGVRGLRNEMEAAGSAATGFRNYVLNALEEGPALAAGLFELGLGIDEVVAAASSPQGMKDFMRGLEESARAAGMSGAQIEYLKREVQLLSDVKREAAEAEVIYAGVTGEAAAAERDRVNAMKEADWFGTAAEIRTTSDAVGELVVLSGDLKTAMDELFGAQISAEEANREYTKGVLTLGGALIEQGLTLDEYTLAGIKNREEVQKRADTIKAVAQAGLDEGRSIQEVTGKMLVQSNALRQQLLDWGFAEDAVDDYLYTLGMTPDQIITAVKLSGATEAENTLNWLARDRKTKVSISSGHSTYSAEGRYVTSPMVTHVGEGHRPEVILPLTNQSRMAGLLSIPQVGGPVMDALGMTMGGAASGNLAPAAGGSGGSVTRVFAPQFTIQAGIGNPAEIGREVDAVLRAYARSGGELVGAS